MVEGHVMVSRYLSSNGRVASRAWKELAVSELNPRACSRLIDGLAGNRRLRSCELVSQFRSALQTETDSQTFPDFVSDLVNQTPSDK